MRALSLDELDFERRFETLKSCILQQRSGLRRNLDRYGHFTLIEYAKTYLTQPRIAPEQREQEFLDVIGSEIEASHGEDVAEQVISQLKRYYFISTADHIGPLSHSSSVSAHLLTALLHRQANDFRYIVALPGTIVSLNNFSFPAGLLSTNYDSPDQSLEKIPLHAKCKWGRTAHRHPPYGNKEIENAKLKIAKLTRDSKIARSATSTIFEFLGDCYGTADVVDLRCYPDQAIRTNTRLWRNLLAKDDLAAPQFVSVAFEKLIAHILCEHHLEKDTSISKLIYSPDAPEFLETHLQNTAAVFSRRDNRGTYLFWAFPNGSHRRLQLWREGDSFVSPDRSYTCPIDPEPLRQALLAGELVPSTFLGLAVLAFYYGVNCLGGTSQVGYLTEMKDAYLNFLSHYGDHDDRSLCAAASTQQMSIYALAFLEDLRGKLHPAGALDLVGYGKPGMWRNLMTTATALTVADSIHLILPTIYAAIYSSKQDPELRSISASDIVEHLCLRGKIAPSVYFSGH